MARNHFDPFASAPATGPGNHAPPDAEVLPDKLGGYRVTGQLGRGAFGAVYSAFDDELQRAVAIKVPRRKFKVTAKDDGFANESRILAKLDHPNIVPVYHVERTDDDKLLIISKLIDGCNLAEQIGQRRLSVDEAARLIMTIAEALHHAHLQGLVHRDIKPANILIDKNNRPYIADFGLALREEDFGKGPTGAGTIPYMSPEQARSEGHRVDGRSDIFSLGVVFYELLTQRRPFSADSPAELLDQIVGTDPRPPRQIADSIPRELERICLKAMSKPAVSRYTTASDMAGDLRAYLDGPPPSAPSVPAARTVAPDVVPPTVEQPAPSSRRPAPIVPKGLRSFDATDADFFLELLPGPRDRDGLPESIRGWRHRIERLDAHESFAVGVIYGPSGSGKSSLAKAGLLPRLPRHVETIYVEAAPDLTEERILVRLRKLCPSMPSSMTLSESVGAIRRGQFIGAGKKVLLVIDQFEQWLQTRSGDSECELVRSMRQCDGGRIQCLLLVRDDFWMAISRLMHELEISIVEGHNAEPVDLFDQRHSRKVLTLLGRAHGALPADPGELSPGQTQFIEQSVAGLSQGGKLVPVRLALFSEMVKSRDWTPATLKAIGGIEGVGVTFLEEAFSAANAPAQHRMHEAAARAVLQLLLPDLDHNIKGTMRSRDELLSASGYASRAADFEDLMQILHKELRLIAPADPQGTLPASSTGSGSQIAPVQHYQLTHDYLVSALRDWLTRKQRETRRGRAELLLADQANVWKSRPKNRHLPTMLQWLSIRLLTDPATWTVGQSEMMQRAGRWHSARIVASFAFAALLVLATWLGIREFRAQNLAQRLVEATTSEVPGIIGEMNVHQRAVQARLNDILAQEAGKDSTSRLHASLALMPFDPRHVDYVAARLLNVEARDFTTLRNLLKSHKDRVLDSYWTLATNRSLNATTRFRACCALATFNPADQRWEALAPFVADELILQNPAELGTWTESLKPVGQLLLPSLETAMADPNRGDEHSRASFLYGEFAQDDAPTFAKLAQRMMALPPAGSTREARVWDARMRANLGIALIQLGKFDLTIDLYKDRDDPTARSYLVHGQHPSRVRQAVLLAKMREDKLPAAVLQGVIIAAGESRLTKTERDEFVAVLELHYRNHPDSGVHSASEWLLNTLGRPVEMDRWEQLIQSDDRQVASTGNATRLSRSWFVNSQRQTMVIVVPPKSALNAEPTEEIPPASPFAIGSTEVTKEQFKRFRADHGLANSFAPTDQCPHNNVSWYDVAAYCNWLSRQDGLPEDEICYVEFENENKEKSLRLKADGLVRKGYRLPTGAEWLMACRAGSNTTFHFGDAFDLLPKYAWYQRNADNVSHPVALLRPNRWGLFDMHGNLDEWCEWHRKTKPVNSDELERKQPVGRPPDATNWAQVRGGHFNSEAGNVSADEANTIPKRGNVAGHDYCPQSGIRVVRTMLAGD